MKGIVIGSSGLVGQTLLLQLCQNQEFKEIVVLVRKSLDFNHPKIKQVIVDFERLDDFKDYLKGDVVFSCLGTTRAKSRTSSEYYKIDYEYPLKLAWMAADNNTDQFHIVSAIGAKEKSSNSYLRIKGETELNISVIKFKSTHFYRPSILDGKRQENRIGEKIALFVMKLMNPLLLGSLKKYRSIKASDVAKAMITQATKNMDGTFYYESDQIQEIADRA